MTWEFHRFLQPFEVGNALGPAVEKLRKWTNVQWVNTALNEVPELLMAETYAV